MIKRQRKLLFYGELPPDSIHGVAISNAINLRFLESEFRTDRVREKVNFNQHSKITISKFFRIKGNICSVLRKSIKCRYDFFYMVMSLSTFGSIKTLSAICAFKLFNSGKVVLHIHRGDFFSSFSKKLVNRCISRLIFHNTDRIVVLSDSQKSDYENLTKKPVFVLFNTVEEEYPFRNKSDNVTEFVFISNYLKEKGILDLLQVFSKLSTENPQLHLSTYGNFSDPLLKKSILNYASENIAINQAVYGSDKFRILSEAGALILPSLNEGQPLVILEALSVGTPVIVTDTGFVRDISGEDYPFLCLPGNIDSLESALVKFLNYKDKSDLSDFLIKRYNEQFSHNSHREILREIFM